MSQVESDPRDCTTCGGVYDKYLGFTMHANNCSAYAALFAQTFIEDATPLDEGQGVERPHRRDDAIRHVVQKCNMIPGSTTWNAAEFMFDYLAHPTPDTGLLSELVEALEWAMSFLLPPMPAHTLDYTERFARARTALAKAKAVEGDRG